MSVPADHGVLLQADGTATHVLVPVEEYELLMIMRAVSEAAAIMDDPATEFVDADEVALRIAADRIAKARRAKGWTQAELGRRLRLPQSQISRLERNPDRTTVRTLKRVAKALGVDVRSLVG